MKTPATQTILLPLLMAGVLICSSINHLPAQSLSFTQPVNFLPQARTDRAIDFTNFNGSYFVSWKEPGKTGIVHACYLGKYYDTGFSRLEATLANEQTAYSPVLQVLNRRLYLLWISTDGSVKYILNNTDTSFNTQDVHTVQFKSPARLAYGLTTTPLNGKLVIASHADNKDQMLYVVIDTEKDGLLKEADPVVVPGKKSADYPFVVDLTATDIRLCWRGYKDENIYYADCNTATGKWTDQASVYQSKSRTSPAVYRAFGRTRLFYIWKGSKNSRKIYYTTADVAAIPDRESALPDYFATNYPVAISHVDDNNFIMVYVGDDQQLYISYFANYDPASWMGDLLLPSKSNYTLKDIVVPGSHDAGMSVLTAAGGQQKGTINECNTLTQNIHIGDQLNAGIRMFDLRVGTYQGELYTKHCSSDCMDSAIGGGYGEKLSNILAGIKKFLKKNNKEIIVLTFSHFCEKETPLNALADSIVDGIGKDFVYAAGSKDLNTVPLTELAGKTVVTFEDYRGHNTLINSCSIAKQSTTFMNFRRAYAATNEIKKLLAAQEAFFNSMKEGTAKNDLVRLDWQLTQSSSEAAMVCNDFQSQKTGALLNGAIMLTNMIKRHESIIDLSTDGNRSLPAGVNGWIANGTINKKNKPNILYVDVAGGWITDFCIDLNKTPLYQQ